MTTNSTDYLRFSAYSIKDFILKKLTDDTNFTDQIYEGSNLAILIDIVSYMYQCLMYNINNAAAESMFSDTQIYENINRLCKFIGYNPKGCSTASAIFTLTNADKAFNNQPQQLLILPYTTLDTGKTDNNGKKIYYSLKFEDDSYVSANKEYQLLFYNGIWKLYSTIFQGTGQEYQTIVLNGLQSDTENKKYIPNDMIDVFVENGNTIEKWTRVDNGIFSNSGLQNIYQSDDKIYSIRLNENKTYEITFGNNFIGKIPEKNQNIYIFYLDSNGDQGILYDGEITDAKIMHSSQLFGITENFYNKLFKINNQPDYQTTFKNFCTNSKWTNKNKSSENIPEENVENIRRNAPEWFKTGNRLVTVSDWEYFVKNNQFSNNILDVKCQNNWQYISTFYRWLYNLGVKNNNPKKYLNQTRLQKNAKYSNASDVNNVYLWIKMKNQAFLYTDQIDIAVQNIKMITQEPVYLTPVNVQFAICAQDIESAKLEYFDNDSNITEFDPENKSYLEITLNENIVYSAVDIKLQIINIIKEFFDENKMRLGQIVNYNELMNKLLSINYVSNIRTIYYNNETGEERIINGISFATWSNEFIDVGDDLDISNTSKSLEIFQFPVLNKPEQLANKIKIIKKALSNINTIQY